MNNKKAQTLKITPAPMWLSEAIDLYKRMDDAGKGHFVECFNPDDQDALLKALGDVGELIYTPGGLHVINGECIKTPDIVETEDDPDGIYEIKADNRVYRIFLNLPLGEQYVPQNEYPQVGQRCIVSAENLNGEGDYYTGYSEACWLANDEAHAKELETAQGVAIITA